MKILLQKQHSIKINVSDGKYECHLQHLPPHSDELRSHYIDCSVNSLVSNILENWRLLRGSIIHDWPVLIHF